MGTYIHHIYFAFGNFAGTLKLKTVDMMLMLLLLSKWKFYVLADEQLIGEQS